MMLKLQWGVVAMLISLIASSGAVARFDDASADCGVGDMTVLVNVKESPQFTNALDHLLQAVPSSVRVLIFPFVPTLHEGTLEALRKAASSHENVRIVDHNEPYLTLGESRGWVLSAGLVDTKYLLCVENIAYFETGFVERMVEKMERIREQELEAFGEEKTTVLIPRLIERCEEAESMWARSHFKSHAEFHPFTCEIEDVRHVVQNWNVFRSDVVLQEGSGPFPRSAEGERNDKTRAWLEGDSTGKPSPVQRIHYVDYLEDHVVLFESAFLREHIGVLGHPDVIWMDDHITEALVVLGAGKKVSLALDEVAYIEFFCSYNLEVLPIIAWRRHDAYMQRSCDVEETFFGVKPVKSCWHWPHSLKRQLFGRIRVPNVVQEFPSFAAGVEQASLRHANLIMGALMSAGRNQFQFVATSAGGEEELEESHWMEPTEALRHVYAVETAQASSPRRELYVRSKSELVAVSSETWRETEKRAGRDLPSSLPGGSALPFNNDAGGHITPAFERDLPDNCLYYTGASQLSRELEEAFLPWSLLSIHTVEHEGTGRNAFFMWTTDADCPNSVSHPAFQLLSTSELIRIPAARDDTSVQVRSFNYLSLRSY